MLAWRLQSLVTMATSRCIPAAEAAAMRRHWEKQKSVTEDFMQACEWGIFRGGAFLWAFGCWLASGEVVLADGTLAAEAG
ncbi:MAG TPA: hypothetical protein VNN22_23645 [Verrucomicrobiae bacterium]|nr:hypothetical protein [Verrucomicrobiae bacterium]